MTYKPTYRAEELLARPHDEDTPRTINAPWVIRNENTNDRATTIELEFADDQIYNIESIRFTKKELSITTEKGHLTQQLPPIIPGWVHIVRKL